MNIFDKKNILVYRDKLLLPSENFIETNYLSFDKIKPYFIANKVGWDIDALQYEFYQITNKLNEPFFKLNGYISNKIFSKIKNIKPKLIHAHFGKGGSLILPLAMKLQIPLFVTYHGADATKNSHSSSFSYRVYNRRKKMLIKHTKKFICVSNFIAERLIKQGFPEDKIFVNPIGIKITDNNYDQIQHTISNPFLFVGRFVEKKGLLTLINAFNILKKNGYDLKINIIGKGPMERQLKNLAMNNANIKFLGWKSKNEIIEYYRNSSALIVPSQMAKNGDCEGLPTVILEGINYQTPIIATNHAGIPEIIKDKQTGFICKENNEDELVTTILKFLSYGNTKEIIFNAKKELSLHFDAIKQSEKLQNLFINND